MQKIGLKNFILPMHGFFFDEKKLTLNIFMSKETSLFSILHPSSIQEQLTPQLKKELAMRLARAIKNIHERPNDVQARDSE